MANKRPYMIITHMRRVERGTKTHVKGWQDQARWEVSENVDFEVGVRTKHWEKASIIIDLLSKELKKNRYAADASDDQIVAHYFEKYRSQVVDFIVRYMAAYGRTVNEALPVEAVGDQ
jgi:hypothetical protein